MSLLSDRIRSRLELVTGASHVLDRTRRFRRAASAKAAVISVNGSRPNQGLEDLGFYGIDVGNVSWMSDLELLADEGQT
jgi:hypothetical protein